MAHPEFGHNLIKRIVDHFDQKIKIDREAKFAGRKLSIIVTPKKHA
jgi:translation initiation factor IF-3